MIAKYYRPDFVKNPKRRRTPHSKKEKSKAATHAALQKGKIQSGDEHRTPKRKNPKRRRTPHSKKEKSKAATNAALQNRAQTYAYYGTTRETAPPPPRHSRITALSGLP